LNGRVKSKHDCHSERSEESLGRLTFEAQSEYIPTLQSDPELRAFEFIKIETDFEFPVNSNPYLRVTRDRSNR
jgi:hypothetical protein